MKAIHFYNIWETTETHKASAEMRSMNYMEGKR